MPSSRLRAKRIVLIGSLAVTLAAVSLVGSIVVGSFGKQAATSPVAAAFSARGAAKVKAAYADWVKQHDLNGGDRYVAVSLGYWKALSFAHTRANGLAKLNLIDGSVSVSVSGLPASEQWDVWLVDNRPGPNQSVKPEPTDAMVRVGRLVSAGDTVKLEAELGPAVFREFHVDLVVVARAGGDPTTTGLLYGAPALFQRLYTALRSEKLLLASDFKSQPGIEPRWASLLGARPAEATSIFVNEDVVFNALVAQGAELFLNEQFNGNGRTCATCHRRERNFTVDVNFIATLPDDDALFVAEFNPALAFTPAGPKFEVPLLMRKHSLIVENVDGMSDLVNRFAMRGVPHTLGLRQSLDPAVGDQTTIPPNQRTGWSGDGAPGNGTLREFATGAVTQHFPRTLNRVNNVDFRLPNDAELDAMEAFQLTLGRQVDLVLPLNFKDPTVGLGQTVFVTAAPADGNPASGAGCNVCHRNAGANTTIGAGGNRNFNTGVENQPDRPQLRTLQQAGIDLTPGVPQNIIPRDGGFGQAPNEGPAGNQTGFGNGRFNSVSLVEAADTGAFFHDNSITTIEGAVQFYTSQEFANAARGGIRLNLSAIQTEAMAAFLRVINALDNIREATETATAARTQSGSTRAELLRQVITEVVDALEVLNGRQLHTTAQRELGEAVVHFAAGIFSNSQLDRGLADLAAARADMVTP